MKPGLGGSETRSKGGHNKDWRRVLVLLRRRRVMGSNQSKEMPKSSPLGCILAHWKELVGYGGIENKKTLVKFTTQWWPLYRFEEGVRWLPTGTLHYETLLQLMLFLRWEQKWKEVTYADMFFSLQNHPEWQRDCGLSVPSEPFVLALEKIMRLVGGG